MFLTLSFSFEKADTHRFEVPRMLLEEPQQLEAYILKTKDKYVILFFYFFFEFDGESPFCFQLKQIYLTNRICENVLLACRTGVVLASERSEFSW